jgi:hypothetical protein
MITITLEQIRKHNSCQEGWEQLLKFQGKTKADNEPFPFSSLLESNGLNDALWALRCLDDPKLAQLLAIAFAQEVLGFMESQRSRNAIRIAHLYLHGEVREAEVEEAYSQAFSAARAASTTYAAHASHAAYAATRAARADRAYVAGCTAYETADATAYAAAYTATYAAADAAKARMQEKQIEWIKIIMDNWE